MCGGGERGKSVSNWFLIPSQPQRSHQGERMGVVCGVGMGWDGVGGNPVCEAL